MTIPATERKAGPFNGNGSTTAFPFGFKVFASSDVRVSLGDEDGAETVLIQDSDYTVVLNPNQETSPGGTITYPIAGAPLPSGQVLVAIGDIPYDQPLDLPSGGNFSPQALENQLDRTAIQIQQLNEAVQRTARVPATYTAEDIEKFTAGILTLADNEEAINTVSDNIGNVNVVADNIGVVTEVAGIKDAVLEVANSSAVEVVAADLGGTRFTNDLGLITDPVTGPGTTAPGAITSVALIIDDVQTVAGVAADIPAVAAVAVDVPAVAAIAADITVVAENVNGITVFADVWQGAKPADPALRNDGSPLQEGDQYFNTAASAMRVYDGTQWSDSVVPASVSITVQRFSGDGSTTAFTLNPVPQFAAACDVAINGAVQDGFTVVGAALTFASPPPVGTDNIRVKVTSAVVGAVPPDGSVTAEKLAPLLDLGTIV